MVFLLNSCLNASLLSACVLFGPAGAYGPSPGYHDPKIGQEAPASEIHQKHYSMFNAPSGKRSRFYLHDQDDDGYISFSLTRGQRALRGQDFNGNVYYQSGRELYLIPKINTGTFHGGYLLGRFGAGRVGGGYSRGSHNWSFAGIPTSWRVTSHFVDLDFGYSFLSGISTQPFLMLGGSISGKSIENGALHSQSLSTRNISLWGIGYSYGFGIDQFVRKSYQITAGIRWRGSRYNKVDGEDVDKPLTSKGVEYYLGFGVGRPSG